MRRSAGYKWTYRVGCSDVPLPPAVRAANESSLSGLDLAQLSTYKNSSEFILSRVNGRAIKVGSYSACNDLESISSYFRAKKYNKFLILLTYKSTTTTYRRNKLTFYMLLVKISSKLEGINLIRNIYDNKLVYFLLINNKLLYMIIFLLSYRAKSSELGLAQDQLVF
jgi:hypothetical protein